jgi:hypothetical protein
MGLADKHWTPISVHNVVLAWLSAEREKISQLHVPNSLLDNANLNDAGQNRERLRLFYLVRSPIFLEIPPDTEWFEVHYLTDSELPELHAINHQAWNNPGDKNELPKVVARKVTKLLATPKSWKPPILWGHGRHGPFTILEGNNRLTAYVGSGQNGISIRVLVGISPLSCVWHILDHCDYCLLQDLLRAT